MDESQLPENADPKIVQFLRKHGSDSSFWMTRTPQERIAASEHLRWMHFGREAMSQPMRKDIIHYTTLEEQDD